MVRLRLPLLPFLPFLPLSRMPDPLFWLILCCLVIRTAAIANASLIFFTFALSLPGLIFRENRGWLKTHAWLVVACALFTLALGLSIWFETLRTRAMLGRMWDAQTAEVQSLLQTRVCSELSFFSSLK